MSGQLSEHPLADLLQEICSRGLSGTLRVDHEHSKVFIYLEDVQLIYAASNVRTLRLAEYLKTHSLATEEQLARFGNKRSDLALADALSTGGIISRKDLETPLRSLT